MCPHYEGQQVKDIVRLTVLLEKVPRRNTKGKWGKSHRRREIEGLQIQPQPQEDQAVQGT